MQASGFSNVLEFIEQDGDDGAATARLRDLSLSSHFQPIYSISHARVVGHEALLRARDLHGRMVSPLAVFAQCTSDDERTWCDNLSRAMHVTNFLAHGANNQWLFLNMRCEQFGAMAEWPTTASDLQADASRQLAQRVVLEVLESEVHDESAFISAVHAARRAGYLVALDDFGAGHSNFDRVWRLQPDIVKLDRSLVCGATQSRRRLRVVTQIVSLLHECGSLVLMEGVETAEEALVAIEADADFVQGYYFGRPQPGFVVEAPQASKSITDLHGTLTVYRDKLRQVRKEKVAPYYNAIGYAGVLLGQGRSMEEACHSFLELPDAEVCFVLDQQGYQVGSNLWSPKGSAGMSASFRPLHDAQGACWARRPYFKRAVESPGKVSVTRPYRTLNGNHMCITASCAYFVNTPKGAELRVVCGDIVMA